MKVSGKMEHEIRILLEKAEKRQEKIMEELTQLQIQITMYKAVLNGGASLDPWIKDLELRKEML